MSTITVLNDWITANSFRTQTNTNFSNLNTDKQETSAKDATGGYAGLTLFKINFKNVANTFTSFFTNSNTSSRTYTFQDRDGTIADNTDLATKAALAGSTSQAFSVSTIDIGNADTTIARSSGGVITVEGVVVDTISASNTLTNKRITKRTGTTTSSATPTINTDTVDFYSITAQSGNITSMTTNLSWTPTEWQTLWIALTATSGTPTVTWWSSFEDSTATAPTALSTTRQDVWFVWNTVSSKWRCVAKA